MFSTLYSYELKQSSFIPDDMQVIFQNMKHHRTKNDGKEGQKDQVEWKGLRKWEAFGD